MGFTLLHNARVYTMDKQCPSADAVLFHGKRVVAVGTRSELEPLAPAPECFDLGGATLLPGLVDAHVHLGAYSQRLDWVDLDGVDDMEKVLARIAEYARRLPPGEWVQGGGYNANLWNVRPHRKLLDRIAPETPVVLSSKDYHTTWVNSAALRVMGIDAGTPDPAGGAIEHDADGLPNGVLRENASWLVEEKRPAVRVERRAEIIRHGISVLHRMGLVGVHAPDRTDEFRALEILHRRGDLPFRVSMMLPAANLEAAVSLGLHDGMGDSSLQISGVKMFVDGSLGSQTAYMLQPYSDSASNHGMAVIDPEELRRLVRTACENGLSVAVHAIGDAANRLAIDAIAGCQTAIRRFGLRNRIEHLQLLAPKDLKRLAPLGIVASMQPLHCTSDIDIVRRYWGEERGCAYAWRSVLDSGAVLAFGSDAPVEVPDPLKGLYAATTRRRADGYPEGGWQPYECLTVPEAVYAYTMGAALACGREADMGSVSPGKLADFTLLSRDIITDGPESIPDCRVNSTMVGGEWVYGGPCH